MGADDGAQDDADKVDAYAEKIQQYFASHGWDLDNSRIAQTQYLLGGTTEADDGTTKRGVVIVAAGEDETLNQSHLAKVQRAVDKYEAEEAFVHARGGASEEHIKFCKENDIRLINPGSSSSRQRQRKQSQQTPQRSISDTEDSDGGLSIDTDKVSSMVSRRTAIAALVGGIGAGIGGVALFTRDGGGGDGNERNVPGASFEITAYSVIEGVTADGGDVHQITVEHSGDPITSDNTHTIRLVPEGGEPFDTWPPPGEGAIDGNMKQFEDLSGTIAPGQTIEFVWISPDTERQSTLDTSTIPEPDE